MYLKTGDLVKSSGGRVSVITEEPEQSYTTRKTEGRDSTGDQEGKPSEGEELSRLQQLVSGNCTTPAHEVSGFQKQHKGFAIRT